MATIEEECDRILFSLNCTEKELEMLNDPKRRVNFIKKSVLDQEYGGIKAGINLKINILVIIRRMINYYTLKISFILFPVCTSKIYENEMRKHCEKCIVNFKKKMKLKFESIDEIVEESNKFMNSKYFLNFIKLIDKIKEEEEDNDFKYDQLICYNLRTFTTYDHCREELYFLIGLREYFKIENCKIIGCNLRSDEIETLKELKFDIISLRRIQTIRKGYILLDPSDCKQNLLTKDGKILIYLSPFRDEDNELILDQNWNSNILNNLHLIGYSFNKIIKDNFKKDKIIKPNSYVFNSSRKLKIVKEYKIDYLDKKEFNYLTLHKFDTKNLDEDMLQSYYSDYFNLYYRLSIRTSWNKVEAKNLIDYLDQSNKLKETKFFSKFKRSFEAFKQSINDNDLKFDRIICYALGRFTVYRRCELQLLFLICLKDYLKVDCEIYDPAFTEFEKKILIQLNFKLINKNEECNRSIKDKKTLFFTYGADVFLKNNILESNWNLKSLGNLYFIEQYTKSVEPYDSQKYSKVYDKKYKTSLLYADLKPHYLVLFDSLKIFKSFNFKPSDDNELNSLNYLSLKWIDVSKIKEEDLNKYIHKYRKIKNKNRSNFYYLSSIFLSSFLLFYSIKMIYKK